MACTSLTPDFNIDEMSDEAALAMCALIGADIDHHYSDLTSWRINMMVGKGYLERSTGPRGGDYFFRATSEGAFQMMVAEGIAKHLSEKFNDPKNVARRARPLLPRWVQACSGGAD